MADFCKQCAEDLGFPRSDFEDPKLKPGLYHTNIEDALIQANAFLEIGV